MILNTPAIRDLLKTRQHLHRAGFPLSHPAIVTVQAVIEQYRKRVGTPAYLSEMLGPLAVLSIGAVRLYGPDGEEMEFKGDERVIDFLRMVQPTKWPWVVSSPIGERYL